MIGRENAEHYLWNEVCEGWHLCKSENLSVILERMPPHTAEMRHLHSHIRQFFYVLEGVATLELEGEVHRLERGQGLEIAPGEAHQMRNDSGSLLEFMVSSSGLSRLDKVHL